MEFGKSRADVAVFVDFENVYVSVREKFDAQPNFELIMDRCEDFGRIVIARAYADWYRYPRVTSALFANGVEPMYVPTYYYDREVGRTGRPIKNSVDIHLCIDAMRTLYTQTHIDKFVLVTGDRDFIPLVNAIRQHGKEVIIIGIGGAASAHLAQSSDEFLFYEQIADIKPPAAAREAGRGERRERGERTETNGRTDARRERGERAPRGTAAPEGSAGRPGSGEDAAAVPDTQETAPELIPEATAEVEAGTAERSPYDTLVDAIHLARQRGFVSNLGSLKVLMRELDSGFNESKVRDANGKAFGKFKDFVKEAERQGRVQIFTNGTVTEVFLPGEDPMRVSQFADELAEQQAEREMENELDREAERNNVERSAPEPGEPEEPTALAERPERSTPRRSRRRGTRPESHSIDFPSPVEAEAADAATPEAELAPQGEEPAFAPEDLNGLGAYAEEATSLPEPPVVAEETATESPAPVFGEREWEIFRSSMTQFAEPVRFADIFSALRGLRNQEVLGLTNNELKELVKQAINRGMLQRTGRGARAYYRLTAQYRDNPAESRAEEPVLDTAVDSAAGLVDADGRAADAVDDVVFGEAQAFESEPLAALSGPQVTLEELVGDDVALQSEETAVPKSRRNRRKKQADQPAADTPDEGSAPQEQAVAEGSSLVVDRPVAEATGEPDQPADAPKKRRTRRKPKAEPEAQ